MCISRAPGIKVKHINSFICLLIHLSVWRTFQQTKMLPLDGQKVQKNRNNLCINLKCNKNDG